MRTFIFILTLLIGLQPAGWAMGSNSPLTQDQLSQELSTQSTRSFTPGQPDSHSRFGLQIQLDEIDHHDCLSMTGLVLDSGTSDCYTHCTACCTSPIFLELPATNHQGSTWFTIYPPPSAYTFISQTGSPEIHPPKVFV